MILKKMFKLCKDRKTIKIYYSDNRSFLSNGYVLADITDIAPEWEVNDIEIAMELDDAALEKFKIEEKRFSEEGCKTLKNVLNLTAVSRLRYSLNVDGKALQPFMLPDGRIIFCDMELMSVFKDVYIKTYRFGYIEKTPAIYVCTDSLCVGMIMPSRVDLETLKAFTSEMYNGATESMKKGFLDAGGQMTITDM